MKARVFILATAAAGLISCRNAPVDGQQDDTSTPVAPVEHGLDPLPSLRLLGSAPGRDEVFAFRFGDVTRSVEVDGFGRVLLRDLSEGAQLEVVLATSAGRPESTHLSENGRWLVVHHGTQAVEVWDAVSGVRLAELGHAGTVQAAFAQDRPIGVVRMGLSVRLVNLETGGVTELGGRTRGVFVAPDGNHAVADGGLWDISGTPELVVKLEGIKALSPSHGFSNDSQRFAYSTYDDELRVLRCEDGQQELVVHGPENGLDGYALTWTDDDAYVLVTDDRSTHILNVARGTITTHAGKLAAVSPLSDSMVLARRADVLWVALADGETLASIAPGSEDASAAFVDGKLLVGDGSEPATVNGPRESEVILSVPFERGTRFDARGVLVASEGDGNHSRLHPDVRSAATDEQRLRTVMNVHAVDFVNEDTLLSYGAGITRWSLDGVLRPELACPLARGTAGQNNGRAKVAALGDRAVMMNGTGVWLHRLDPQCSKAERRADGSLSVPTEVDALAPNAASVLVVDDDNVLNLGTGATLELGAGAARDATLNASGDALAIRMWNGVRILQADGSARDVETGPTSAIAWDRNSDRLVVAGKTGLSIIDGSKPPSTVALSGASLDPDEVEVSNLSISGALVAWNAESDGKERLVLASLETGSVLASVSGSFPFALSPDTDALAFAPPGWIRTFSGSAGREVTATRTQLREVERLAFSPGGTRLAAVGHGLEVFEL